ncbi:MAG: VOC family protein [Chitinophagaceae bacterium]|nr:VOC family protein [Chitinophagaceae bacterium]
MKITPYIIFNGNCEEALKFYEKSLGGKIGMISRYADAPPDSTGNMKMDPQKIMHSHLTVDGNLLLMASDGPTDAKDSGIVHLSLDVTDGGTLENIFSTMSEGGRVNMPLQDTFWGARFGMLTDRFGVNWMFNYEKPKS